MLSRRTSHRHYPPFSSFLPPSLIQPFFDPSTLTEGLSSRVRAHEAACQIDHSSYYGNRYLEMHAHLGPDLRKEIDDGREGLRHSESGFTYSTQHSQLTRLRAPANWPVGESPGRGIGSEQGRGGPNGLHETSRARPDKRIFGCRRCNYVTDRKNNLKRHVMAMHQRCGRMLECCDLAFDSKAALRDHVISYHDSGYSCLYCQRSFCRKALLKRHLAVHDGRKDYACADCGYATSHKSNLERHKKVHQSLQQLQNWTSSEVIDGAPDDDVHRKQDGSRYCNSSRKLIHIPNDNGHDSDNEYIDVVF